MAMKDVHKIDHTKEELNQAIVQHIQNGMTRDEISKKLNVSTRYIHSVHSTNHVQIKANKIAEGGVHLSYLGRRLTDGKPSPVTTYNVFDLTPQQREELGIDISTFASPNLKRCKECNQRKEVSEFYKRKPNKDGLSGKCKSCSKKNKSTNV
ncbi:hypothetical protein ACQR3P_31920 [Rhodococcus sp. IEGM1300]